MMRFVIDFGLTHPGIENKRPTWHQVGRLFSGAFWFDARRPRTSGLSPDPPWPLPARLAELQLSPKFVPDAGTSVPIHRRITRQFCVIKPPVVAEAARLCASGRPKGTHQSHPFGIVRRRARRAPASAHPSAPLRGWRPLRAAALRRLRLAIFALRAPSQVTGLLRDGEPLARCAFVRPERAPTEGIPLERAGLNSA